MSCCGDPSGTIDNSTIEGQPEYGKSYKKEHNAGCCCGCSTRTAASTTQTVVRQTNVR